ncbi:MULTISPECIES: tripartite tricarboxylate transporter substrate binding protein [unclassified Beijerinckia]|uniref:Bug family tripartite tricarboxylate transporter substrate binding protein n=1 Tax=unclassified Beijerinckia TaxID=2638183 RepID=UPI00089A4985|nr:MULTISPECIES: tripartite tricarboxylate transporter substrate binding protein [unclassified Beijerinckia]MDH7794601.1 tripartite-type tricarboxylate transporter receptor subunit TctC [Beijerinckia sp. GAS462]SEB68125.1 Tripartite-type tricarboxylate transporter, receptor component TctC [Beijerinckia sp. 28-YEA-48]
MIRKGIGRMAVFCFAMFTVALLTGGSSKAQNFPNKTVIIVVPYAAGGSGDILARLVGAKLETKWGQAVVVENRIGAGGNIGAAAVARATPDGTTLLLGASPQFTVNVTLFKKLPYDPEKELTPLAMAAATPFVLVVNPSVPVKTVKEFIDYAKASPQPLSYATAGYGVPHHLYMELLKSMTGVQMNPVPYRGSVPALTDVVAGHVPVMFVDLGPGLGQMQSGAVRSLGVSLARRLDVLPDVPPINDTLPGFDVASWQMFAAPSGTPQPILEKLSADIRSVLEMPDIAEAISKAGMLPLPPRNIEDLQKFVKAELIRWGDVVRKAGLEGSQ